MFLMSEGREAALPIFGANYNELEAIMKTAFTKNELLQLYEQGADVVVAMPENGLVWAYSHIPHLVLHTHHFEEMVCIAHDDDSVMQESGIVAVGITEQGQEDWGEGFRDVFAARGYGPDEVAKIEAAWNDEPLGVKHDSIEFPWETGIPPEFIASNATCIADAAMIWADGLIRWAEEHRIV